MDHLMMNLAGIPLFLFFVPLFRFLNITGL